MLSAVTEHWKTLTFNLPSSELSWCSEMTSLARFPAKCIIIHCFIWSTVLDCSSFLKWGTTQVNSDQKSKIYQHWAMCWIYADPSECQGVSLRRIQWKIKRIFTFPAGQTCCSSWLERLTSTSTWNLLLSPADLKQMIIEQIVLLWRNGPAVWKGLDAVLRHLWSEIRQVKAWNRIK